jgi:asparagine synthase (glutamine-hydrolysing)
MKVDSGGGTRILKTLLHKYVPRELVDRPKAGFQVPVGEWIRGPLREWAEDLLEELRMRTDGWLDADLVGARWRDHLSGKRDSTSALWAILMFQAWAREQTIPSAAAA